MSIVHDEQSRFGPEQRYDKRSGLEMVAAPQEGTSAGRESSAAPTEFGPVVPQTATASMRSKTLTPNVTF
jgi:hypothetical protein